MGNKESNESAAVKRQAEGGANPMYELLDLSGGGLLFHITKRAMVKKDNKELDEAIKAKVTPFLYNNGEGKLIPIAQMACIRNRDRSKKKWMPCIQQLNKDIGEDAAFRFVFEGSEFLNDLTEGLDPVESPHLFRDVCWMVEKRGFVGESAFHVCFLMQTPTHLFLGRRLLKHYPKLINDIYMSEEYYGENVLHMSCVAEDPTMVKWLLDQGIDFHEKCYGNFFCPEDQKMSRMDSLDHEEVDVCTKTNYAGYVYWGEYSLCFAAVLNQEECFRLILSRGGNPDLIDTNGNTITHIMVIYDNMRMFDLAVESGATIATLNNLKLNPLACAAYLARKDMFFHIANIEREVYWQIGNVCCSAYPIEQMDSIDTKTGELNTQSALNLIVFGKKIDHLDLIEGIVVDLLKVKWRCFIQKNFMNQIARFVVYFLIASYVFIVRPSNGHGDECVPISSLNETNIDDVIASNSNHSFFGDGMIGSDLEFITPAPIIDGMNTTIPFLNLVLPSDSTEEVKEKKMEKKKKKKRRRRRRQAEEEEEGGEDEEEEEEGDDDDGLECADDEVIRPIPMCRLNEYHELTHQIRLGGEIILVLWSIYYLGVAVREYAFLGWKIWLQTMLLSQSRVGFLIGRVLLLIMIPLRVTCRHVEEDILAIFVMITTAWYFLFFCRGFKLTGPFVIMIYRMMAADLLRFGIIYVIFVMGFAQSFYIIFQSYDETRVDEEDADNAIIPYSPSESILVLFVVSTGNFGDFVGGIPGTNHSAIGHLTLFIFLSLVFVMLINLLIAMMGDTYTRIAEIKNEWIRQWARMVLIVERGIAPKERLQQQDLYAERMSTGVKALTLKQSMSPDQLQEIKDIIEMKVSHRKNINRRKEKFGYESNSLIGLNMTAAALQQADSQKDCFEEE